MSRRPSLRPLPPPLQLRGVRRTTFRFPVGPAVVLPDFREGQQYNCCPNRSSSSGILLVGRHSLLRQLERSGTVPGRRFRHREHRERGLERIVADAPRRVAGHVQQTAGSDQTVAASGSHVSQIVLLSALQIDVGGGFGAEEEQVFAAHRVVAASSLKKRCLRESRQTSWDEFGKEPRKTFRPRRPSRSQKRLSAWLSSRTRPAAETSRSDQSHRGGLKAHGSLPGSKAKPRSTSSPVYSGGQYSGTRIDIGILGGIIIAHISIIGSCPGNAPGMSVVEPPAQ